MIYTTQSLEETQCLAKEIARNLSGRSTIFFMEGEMGAGKTTFAHFLAKEINGQKISSSSFGLVNVYNGDRVVVHCDFYRQHWDHEFYETEILEHLDSSSVLILEWVSPFILEPGVNTYRIKISIISPIERQIVVDPISLAS